MKLDTDTTIDQFRDEMQHRVVKYPLKSRPVREALRFAKKHEDPAYYRIASDKMHAQRQFQRELYGPTKWESVVELFTLGTAREAIIILVLVVTGALSLEGSRKLLFTADEDLYADMDVDALAQRLGILLDIEDEGSPTEELAQNDAAGQELSVNTAIGDMTRHKTQRLDEEDVERIARAVVAVLREDQGFRESFPSAADEVGASDGQTDESLSGAPPQTDDQADDGTDGVTPDQTANELAAIE
jgi:hypothetical protein